MALKENFGPNSGFNVGMGRRAKGNEVQRRSDTALFANIAYRLEGIALKELDGWVKALKVDIGVDALRKAPSFSARLEGRGDSDLAVRRSVAVDWGRLNFFMAVARMTLYDRGNADRLAAVPGVVDYFSLGERDVMLVVVYERLHDRQDLRSGLLAFGELVTWEEVEERRSDTIVGTTRALARRFAERENLAKGS